MKKILSLLVVLVLLLSVVGCASKPDTKPSPAPQVKVYPPQILEYKGQAYGAAMPKWLDSALEGPKAVEKLPEFANQYIVIVEADGQDLTGADLVASRMNAQTTIAQLISTRVKDTFAGAQVGDKDKIETYMERCVKSVSASQFSGFGQLASTWSKLQTFTTDGKPDQQIYRVMQVWGINKDTLQQQIDKVLKGEANAEPKTPEKQRAMDMVQQSFFEGF